MKAAACARFVAVAALMFGVAPLVMAAKTYTPSQLHRMVDAGHPPKQGKVTTKTMTMRYAACIENITTTLQAIGASYPSKPVVVSDQMTMLKLWTNDAAMTLSCSASDQKMVITQAPYS